MVKTSCRNSVHHPLVLSEDQSGCSNCWCFGVYRFPGDAAEWAGHQPICPHCHYVHSDGTRCANNTHSIQICRLPGAHHLRLPRFVSVQACLLPLNITSMGCTMRSPPLPHLFANTHAWYSDRKTHVLYLSDLSQGT